MNASAPLGAAAYIVDDPGSEAPDLLASAVARAGLWQELERVAGALGVGSDDLRVLIKPELGAFALGSPAATAPTLVEGLIDLLHGRGYAQVAVAAAADSSTLWAENREARALADLLGYRYVTDAGRPYEVIDLGEDLVDVGFAEGTLLHGSLLARAWRDAHFRITFAKNRADEQQGYALSLDTLIGVLPLADKDYYYRHRFDPGEVVVELLRTLPIQFALIDAWTSSHGAGGGRSPRPIATKTLIASSYVLLADYAGALKMGLDPYVSEISRRALQRIGLPPRYRIEGNLAPYPDWVNVHPVVVDSSRRRDAWTAASRGLKPWLQVTDSELFPFKDPVDARVNAALAPRFANVDGDRSAFWTLVFANYALSSLHGALESYRVLWDKDALRHREAPLNLDLDAYGLGDYEATRELLDLFPLLRDLPSDEHGLRWRYLEDAVLFEFVRTIPIPFRQFVEKVDVSRTIQFMNDYLGGAVVPVARDEHGRVTHQAERNIYLPQPNYLVLYQGKVIDVTKLEFVEYEEDRHRISWKTLKSENGSARYDDGVVAFERAEAGTRVSIFGRQLFELPPFWQAVDLDLAPEIKASLVTDAYRIFFSRTLANFEALVEGREIRIGSAWHEPEDPRQTEPRPVERLGAILEELGNKYGDLLKGEPAGRRGQYPGPKLVGVDEQGFSHFAPGPESTVPADAGLAGAAPILAVAREALASFWGDLAEAVRRDREWQAGRGTDGPG